MRTIKSGGIFLQHNTSKCWVQEVKEVQEAQELRRSKIDIQKVQTPGDPRGQVD